MGKERKRKMEDRERESAHYSEVQQHFRTLAHAHGGGGHCLAKQGRNLGALVAAGLGCKHLAWGAVRSAAHTALSGDTV